MVGVSTTDDNTRAIILRWSLLSHLTTHSSVLCSTDALRSLYTCGPVHVDRGSTSRHGIRQSPNGRRAHELFLLELQLRHCLIKIFTHIGQILPAAELEYDDSIPVLWFSSFSYFLRVEFGWENTVQRFLFFVSFCNLFSGCFEKEILRDVAFQGDAIFSYYRRH